MAIDRRFPQLDLAYLELERLVLQLLLELLESLGFGAAHRPVRGREGVEPLRAVPGLRDVGGGLGATKRLPQVGDPIPHQLLRTVEDRIRGVAPGLGLRELRFQRRHFLETRCGVGFLAFVALMPLPFQRCQAFEGRLDLDDLWLCRLGSHRGGRRLLGPSAAGDGRQGAEARRQNRRPNSRGADRYVVFLGHGPVANILPDARIAYAKIKRFPWARLETI